MGNELLNRTSKEVFNSIEKWNAFLELISKKEELELFWYQNFKRFVLENKIKIPGWICSSNGNHLFWQLESSDLQEKSLSIWFESKGKGEFEIVMWASKEAYHIEELNKELKVNNSYISIKEVFKLNGEIDPNYHNEYIFSIKPDFCFENREVNNSNIYWYLGNKSKEMYDQLNDLIKNILNTQNTTLLEHLHKSCIKKT